MNQEHPSDTAEYTQAGTAAMPVARPVSTSRFGAESILVPLGRWEATIELGFVLFVLLFPSLVRSVLFDVTAAGLSDDLGRGLYAWVVCTGALALVVLGFVMYKNGHPWRSVGWTYRSVWSELWAAGIALASIYVLQTVLIYTLYFVNPQVVHRAAEDRVHVAEMFNPAGVHPVALIVFCLFVGLWEELIFRGFMLTRLRMLFGNWVLPILVASVAFAVLHAYEGSLAVVQIFVVSLVLSVLFVVRGSVVAAVLTHAAFNFVGLSAARFMQQSEWLKGLAGGGVIF